MFKQLGSGDLTPQPPTDLTVLSETSEYIFTGVIAALAFLTVVYAVVLSRRYASWIPVLCCAGGTLAVFTEPLIDSHLQVWWPHHNQPDVLDIWGRQIPIVGLLAILFYFGAGSYLRWSWLQQARSVKTIWMLFLIEAGVALIMEPMAIKLRIWHYYGDHGLTVFHYPVYWPFIASAAGVATGTVLFKLTPHLTSYRVLLAVPLVPSVISAIYWFCGWPMYTALNAEPAKGVLILCNLASIGLAVTVVWICTLAVARPQPARGDEASLPAQAERVLRDAEPAIATR